ncbi:MAG: ABC transporter substrate-binding protein [Ectothiorhodospiraceae bacterium]|nr:ABC transporter substrate-binding protein [Ectothiorhodospiraceae bacterium]
MAFGAAGAAKADNEHVLSVASMADFTGPYADIFPPIAAGRRAVFDWWNAEIGADLGVRIRIREYDHRYDAARVASMWPGIRSDLNPVLILGVGGPDVAALRERLPDDKVPMIMATAGYGYAWMSDPWIFNPRATYAHEAAAFLNWYKEDRSLDRPVKLGIISSEASPAYVDIARGMQKYAEDNPDVVELVETIWTAVQPDDLTAHVHRIVRRGAEVIQIQTNTAAVVAAKRALQAIGRPDVVIMTSSHNGLPMSGSALGGIDQLEGNYEAHGQALGTADPTVAREFYDMLVADYDLTAGWNVATIMGLNQGIVAVRAIEAAVAEYGAGNVTGEAIREMMFATEFDTAELFEILPTLNFTREAPFPVAGLSVNIATVKDGEYTLAELGYPVPILNPW